MPATTELPPESPHYVADSAAVHPVVRGLAAILEVNGRRSITRAATRSGVERGNIRTWINGLASPRIDLLDAVLGAFDFELAIRRKAPMRFHSRIEPIVETGRRGGDPDDESENP